MKRITIANTELAVKDYRCAEAKDFCEKIPEEEYIRKENPGLWLYVNVTDSCNLACPFCVNGSNRGKHIGEPELQQGCGDVFNPEMLAEAIRIAKPYIHGISFTGGEPMLYAETVDEAIACVSEILSDDIEIDLVTNGTGLKKLAAMKNIDKLTSIHISRHWLDETGNRELMQGSAPSAEEIKEFVRSLSDPGKVVLNCVVQKGWVDCTTHLKNYLDAAISLGVRNVSFITMFRANDYCKEHYIPETMFSVISDNDISEWNAAHPDAQFSVWNRHSDHDYCHCISESYKNAEGRIRFYFRCPGKDVRDASVCRQLVFTPDNCLRDGFGKDSRIIWKA